MLMLSGFISAEDRKQYFKYGYILKENFLNTKDFQEFENESLNFKHDTREAIQGNTITQRAVLSPDVLKNYPGVNKVLQGNNLKRLTRFAAGHLREPFYYLEKVKNQYSDGNEDPQKQFHHDTFHPSMKCWLFIENIEENAGAFTYIPSSQILDWKRIKWEYRMSINANKSKNNYHSKGSTRFSKEDILELDLPEPKIFNVKKNTLLIVNVFGIHRRGNSEGKSTRLALWGDSRTNPFIPLPGIGGKFINYWQYYFLDMYRNRIDRLSSQKGTRSPWQLVTKRRK